MYTNNTSNMNNDPHTSYSAKAPYNQHIYSPELVTAQKQATPPVMYIPSDALQSQNVELYEQIVNELKQIYKDKNHDYGNSFSILFEKFGLTSVVIRLWDKILRLETLTKTEAKVKDESITDTLKDIINYSIMTLIELEKRKGEIIK